VEAFPLHGNRDRAPVDHRLRRLHRARHRPVWRRRAGVRTIRAGGTQRGTPMERGLRKATRRLSPR
jgi:hypothetical protein